MGRSSRIRCLVAATLALAGLAAPSRADAETLRLSQNIAGDSNPIVLSADQVVYWTEGNQRVLLLKGTVLAEQGIVRLRAQEAVGFVDLEKAKRTNVLRLDLYAEGDVRVEQGPDSRAGPSALIDLSTRGEVKLRAQNSKAVQETRTSDPIYGRGLTERGKIGPGAVPDAVQRTSALAPAAGAVVPAQWPPPPPTALPPPTQATAPPATAATPPPSLPATLPPPRPLAPPVAHNPTDGPVGMLGNAPPRQFRMVPRTSARVQVLTKPLPNGEQAIFVTGGVILTVADVGGINLLDIEADRVVFWTRDNLQQLFSGMQSPEGQSTRQAEFYFAGNVEIRSQAGRETKTLRASEIYYDVSRNVAVAHDADLEFKQPGLPDPVHMRADELLQLSPTQFKGYRTEVFSSRLPSDPGLKVSVAESTLDEVHVPKRTIFGTQFIDQKTGQPETAEQRLFKGRTVFLKLEDVPIFYLPFVQGDANDPLGPLDQVNIGFSRIYGARFMTTFNVYDLIGIDPVPGTRWKLYADYLSRRGPALGTEYDYAGKDLFGLEGRYSGLAKAYGIYDTGTDILGGGRGADDNHPIWRGRFLERHSQELPYDFTLQTQISALSDKNFLEQYYKNEFDRDVNQETFAYLKQQRDDWAWTLLAEPRIRNWVTETEWLPRANGYLLGQSFFDLFTYNARASAGYAKLRPTDVPPPPFSTTDLAAVSTGRFDVFQELSLPVMLGPVKVAPYGVLDLTYYTQDIEGNDRGRVYGAGGVRSSMPLSRLYPDVQSELLNVNGVYHKIVLSSNFYAARSDTPHTLLPQLDRLNDDATDQALRDIKPLEPVFNPRYGTLLATSPLYDPQLYAIRRLVDNRIDTLDSVEVLELDARQRLQTKRGYPGMQHTVDWMTLELSGSYFPNSSRDNFGENWAFLQYNYTWNVGDRTALVSTGWLDPIDNGAQVFTIGSYFNRPDRTNFYLGYRQIQPLESQAVTAAVNYLFSPKYAMALSSTYDFGTKQSLSNALTFARMGSDLQVSLGITYNALQNNFGMIFEILPNLVPESRRVPGRSAFNSAALGR